MADESIGSVSVSISGDASQLIKDFEQAQQTAKVAGEQVAQAFTASGSSQLAVLQGQYAAAATAIRQSVDRITDAEKQSTDSIRSGHTALAASLQAIANTERTALDGLIQSQTRLSASMAEVKYSMVSVDQAALDLTVGIQRLAIAQALMAQQALEDAAAVETFGFAIADTEVKAKSFVGVLPGFGIAAERFVGLLPGLGNAIMAAFPVLGAIAFGEALYNIGERILHASSGMNVLAEAQKALDASTKQLTTDYAQLSKEIEHIQIEDLTVRFGKAAGQKLAAFYSAQDLADDKDRIKVLIGDIDRAKAKLASDATEAQTKSNPLVSTLEAFNPFVTGQRFAANEDYKAQQLKIRQAEDELGALQLKVQKAGSEVQLHQDKEDKDRSDAALAAAKAAATALKAIDDAQEHNALQHNSKLFAQDRDFAEQQIQLQKLTDDTSIAGLDDVHKRAIAAASEDVAVAVARQADLGRINQAELDSTLALLTENEQQASKHGKAAAAEVIRIEGEKQAARDRFAGEELKLAAAVVSAKAALGVVEVTQAREVQQEIEKATSAAISKQLDAIDALEKREIAAARAIADAQIKISQIAEGGGLAKEKLELERNYALALDHSAQAQARLGEATLAIDRQILQTQVDRAAALLHNDTISHASASKIAADQVALATAYERGSEAIFKQETHVKQLEQASSHLHQAWVGLRADFDHAFQSLAHNLSSAIIGAKSFHDAWQATIKGVAQSILDTLIGAALGALEQAIIKVIVNFLGVKTATSIANVHAVLSYAAVAFAATFASIAAIPIVGPFLAPGAAAAAYATVAAEAPLAAFDKGGWVDEDQIARIHKGEFILTASQMAGSAPLPQLPGISSSSNSSSSSIGEVHVHVSGAQRPQETAREIARYLKGLSPKFSPAG